MFVIGATNYIAKLDPAILRTGRLDSVIYLGMPDEAAILDILKKSLKKSQLQYVHFILRWCERTCCVPHTCMAPFPTETLPLTSLRTI